MSTLQAIILAIIQGITEFLPISSTGHMIFGESLMKISNPSFARTYIVNIHFGTVLAVLTVYLQRFFKSFDFYFKLFVGFLPAMVIGLLLNNFIDHYLTNVIVVAVSLFIGGIILIFVDKWFKGAESTEVQEITYLSALKIGFYQVIAMIPGISRSAATIIGGMTQKLNRKNAAEFSFFLAVPTVLAASGYKLLKSYKEIQSSDLTNLILGNIIAYIVAILIIRTFISYISKHGFKLFGYYRIILGIIIIVLFITGVLNNSMLLD
ncbi:MAG: undecaprenyl-diphosphate phosphatase [Bacteroidota bacterium]|nr:undecaprenyl-diphosphate phosphatase [Bacteroidota bacterium]